MAGAILVPLVGLYFQSDKRISWEYIGVPPETPVRFISTYQGQGFLVEGASSIRYENCGKDCWTSKNLERHYEVEELNCPDRNPPEFPELELKTSFCTPWGPGMIYSSYGVSEDGAIYVWERRSGEWDSLASLMLPFIGGIGFLLIGLIFVLIKSFNDYLDHLRKRSSEW
jgi:hypothetical protein